MCSVCAAVPRASLTQRAERSNAARCMQLVQQPHAESMHAAGAAQFVVGVADSAHGAHPWPCSSMKKGVSVTAGTPPETPPRAAPSSLSPPDLSSGPTESVPVMLATSSHPLSPPSVPFSLSGTPFVSAASLQAHPADAPYLPLPAAPVATARSEPAPCTHASPEAGSSSGTGGSSSMHAVLGQAVELGSIDGGLQTSDARAQPGGGKASPAFASCAQLTCLGLVEAADPMNAAAPSSSSESSLQGLTLDRQGTRSQLRECF
jgi:hypothetical protein